MAHLRSCVTSAPAPPTDPSSPTTCVLLLTVLRSSPPFPHWPLLLVCSAHGFCLPATRGLRLSLYVYLSPAFINLPNSFLFSQFPPRWHERLQQNRPPQVLVILPEPSPRRDSKGALLACSAKKLNFPSSANSKVSPSMGLKGL